MPKRLTVTLSVAQHDELVQARDHHEKAYMREKAAAILKLEDHQSALQVAEHGLLKRRDDNTVRAWLTRYLRDGLDGLLVHPGRGRKPAFSPSARISSRRRGIRGGASQPHPLRA